MIVGDQSDVRALGQLTLVNDLAVHDLARSDSHLGILPSDSSNLFMPVERRVQPLLRLFRAQRERSRIEVMGKLLDRAIQEAHKLSDDEQEAIGAWLLAEIESERRWDELFSRPPSEALNRLAEEALEDFRAGRTQREPGVR